MFNMACMEKGVPRIEGRAYCLHTIAEGQAQQSSPLCHACIHPEHQEETLVGRTGSGWSYGSGG